MTIEPASGSAAGGTRLTLTGEGFTSEVAVLFAGAAAEELTCLNDRVLEVVTPPGEPGAVTVEILARGRSAVKVAEGFTYVTAELVDFSPTSGPASGHTELDLHGSGFGPDTSVLFGELPSLETTFISEEHVKALAPPASPGFVALTVRSGGQSQPSSLEYEYLANDPSDSDDSATPRVVSAAALDNVTVLVTFSEAMGDRAESARSYQVSAESAEGTPTVLAVREAEFVTEGGDDPDRSRVMLTTGSQSGVAYTLRVNDVADAGGQVFAAPAISVGGAIVDPAVASFVGFAPSGQAIDSDGDGLPDPVEQLGWTVRVVELDGTEATHTATSDPLDADSDGDGVDDLVEKQWLTEPRGADTDADDLTDYQELNELLSDPTHQDTDGDTLPDGYEFNFFQTSPLLADTDGDQLRDDYELLFANRNARVADLPAPTIEVGETNLQLDVRFTEQSALETRELETKSATATLTQSQKQDYSNTNTETSEFFAKVSVGTDYEVKASIFDPGGTFTSHVNVEAGWTGTWTSTHTETSSAEATQAYEDSLSTEEETRENATVTRTVAGATMQVAVFVKNASDLAYHVRNLQLTAFIQDPQDPTALTPLATLLPDAEPEGGYTLGPLVPERGPFIFSNDLIFPNLVETLMKDPRGLIFRISNFDIDDELGRSFAFSSQEVVERTTALIIDNGSFDTDGDGEGDLTEYHRVATGTGRLMDTSGDGVADEGDRRVVFDGEGQQLGVTLEDALGAIGLTHYDEAENPTDTLSESDLENSYSTILDEAGVQRVFRVRGKALTDGVPKSWEVMTPTGIDQTRPLAEFILEPQRDIRLVFAQDLDGDRIPANVEFLNNCSDELSDTDADGLDDRTEVLLGREVETSRGARRIFTSCSLADTDRDGLGDSEEAHGAADCDGDGDAETSFAPTDATARDTDADTLVDKDEVCGFEISFRSTGETFTTSTEPTNADSDGDTADDGIERRLGGDPNDAGDRDDFTDDDGDGLVNVQELDGWQIEVFGVSTSPALCDSRCDEGPGDVSDVGSEPTDADSDGDGLLDGEEWLLGTDPGLGDTDGDGLEDPLEVRGFEVRELGVILTDPVDADTDDDKRSDGAEAELEGIEQDRWIVRVQGAEPYQVWSNPLVADEDFDTLVDGDELAASGTGTDPTHYNTDGDARDDAVEVAQGLDPLSAADLLVQQVRVRVDRFECLMADDEGAVNTVDMTEFRVALNGSACRDEDDAQCDGVFSTDQDIYFESGSEWNYDAGGVRMATASAHKDTVFAEFNTLEYSLAASEIRLWGHAVDDDGTFGIVDYDEGTGEITLLGSDLLQGVDEGYFDITSATNFTFRAYFNVQLTLVPCSEATTETGQCELP